MSSHTDLGRGRGNFILIWKYDKTLFAFGQYHAIRNSGYPAKGDLLVVGNWIQFNVDSGKLWNARLLHIIGYEFTHCGGQSLKLTILIEEQAVSAIAPDGTACKRPSKQSDIHCQGPKSSQHFAKYLFLKGKWSCDKYKYTPSYYITDVVGVISSCMRGTSLVGLINYKCRFIRNQSSLQRSSCIAISFNSVKSKIDNNCQVLGCQSGLKI